MKMRKIIRQIARENGVTPAEVKRDMQAVIDFAYQNKANDGVTAAYQSQIPRKGEVPTIEELVAFASKKIKANL